MSEAVKYGSVIAWAFARKMAPVAAGVIGGYVLSLYPAVFNAFCQVN